MDVNLGRFVLGLYTALLGIGGMAGSISAGSHKSLVAGIGSAFVCLALLLVSIWSPRTAFALSFLLALGLAIFFIVRMRRSGKFMPAGILAGISFVFAAFFVLAASAAETAQPTIKQEVTATAAE